MGGMTTEERFQFDLQGYLVVRGVLTPGRFPNSTSWPTGPGPGNTTRPACAAPPTSPGGARASAT